VSNYTDAVSTYEPGTVAVATVCGVPNVRVMRIAPTAGTVWVSTHRAADGAIRHFEGDVTEVRPIVVLDLDDPAAMVRMLRTAVRTRGPKLSAAINDLADEIETQIRMPRIPEPGLWGVVNAHTLSLPVKTKWVRMVTGVSSQQWLNGEAEWVDWDELINPRLVRPGIEAKS
jgi:hypothetical protein